jgi:hypothetical protein
VKNTGDTGQICPERVFYFWTWDLEKKGGQEENDLSFLYHDGNPRLLSFDIKEWSLDRRPQNLSI